jgi:hypothetical protein
MQVKEEMLKPFMAADSVHIRLINATCNGIIREGFGCINTISFVNLSLCSAFLNIITIWKKSLCRFFFYGSFYFSWNYCSIAYSGPECTIGLVG